MTVKHGMEYLLQGRYDILSISITVLAHFSDAHTANNALNRKAACAMAASAPWNVLQKSTCAEIDIVDELRGQRVEALVRSPPPPPTPTPILEPTSL
jgi:hypothetical protein